MAAALDPAALPRTGGAVRPAPAPALASRESAAGGEPPRVLFVAPDLELRFVAQDLSILSSACTVEVVLRRDHPQRRDLLREVRRRLGARHFSLVYVWFAEPYDAPFLVLLARLRGVPTALVTGGYDVAALPEIGYGSVATLGGRWRVKTALLAAHTVLPFSRFSAGEVAKIGRRRRVRTLYPGVDCAAFAPAARPDGGEEREPLVLTVGAVSRDTWRRKGLDVFARASRLLPGVRFAVVGRTVDEDVAKRLRELGGDNLTLVGRRVTTPELAGWYRRAAVYAQLSAHEGFGLALAEAMACGCVPVAAAVGSLPEVVGEAGFLVAQGDAGAAAQAIGKALAGRPGGLGEAARRRIAERFPLERRRRELLEVVAGMMPGSARASFPADAPAAAVSGEGSR